MFLRGIEQVTGNINNFSITPYEGEYEDHPSSPTTLKNIEVLRIIDESMMLADFENKDDYYQFPILRYNSLVTDYKLSSTISQNIATTVSIGAQNVGTNHSPTGENSVFNAFNQGIKDRLAQPIIDHINSPDDLALIEQQTQSTKSDSLNGLFLVISRIYNNSMNFPKDTSLASKTLNDYINYFNGQLPAVNKLFYSFTPFPLSLSLTLDGISGIAVGSIIRLPTDRLPLLYRYLDPGVKDGSFNEAKVAFVVFGVDHTVDDRGWFTNLTCQMIMMPRGKDADEVDLELKDNTITSTNPTTATKIKKTQNISPGDMLMNPTQDQNLATAKLTSPFPYRKNWRYDKGPKKGQRREHLGIDFSIDQGTPLIAVQDGKLQFLFQKDEGNPSSTRGWGYGQWALLTLDKPEPIAGARKVVYGHMSAIYLNGKMIQASEMKTGRMKVKKGDVIGLSGGEKGAPGAGNSAGPHLHYAVGSMMLHGGSSYKKLKREKGEIYLVNNGIVFNPLAFINYPDDRFFRKSGYDVYSDSNIGPSEFSQIA